jgi:hypothetical protein
MNPEIDLEQHEGYLAKWQRKARTIVIAFFCLVAIVSAYTYFVGW